MGACYFDGHLVIIRVVGTPIIMGACYVCTHGIRKEAEREPIHVSNIGLMFFKKLESICGFPNVSLPGGCLFTYSCSMCTVRLVAACVTVRLVATCVTVRLVAACVTVRLVAACVTVRLVAACVTVRLVATCVTVRLVAACVQ